MLALAVLLAGLYLALHAVVSRSFDAVEQRYASQNLTDARRAIDDQLGLLDRSVIDYAVWDDSYAFLRGELDSYTSSNFTDGMFASNQLDLVLLFSTDGSAAYRRILGPQGDLSAADQNTVEAAIVAAKATADLPADTPRHTVILTRKWPLMLSAHRVLRSDGSGPSDGIFVMGRWIDAELATELSQRLHLKIDLLPLDQPLPADLPREGLELTRHPDETIIVALDAQRLCSYSVISDRDGRPVVLSQLTSDRPIWATGQRTILVTLGVFILAGIIFTASIALLLDRIVLARLRRLMEGVRLIGSQQDLARRVEMDGSDELSLLAGTINQTMSALEQADLERRQAEQQREEMWQDLIDSRRAFIATISHELRTPLTPIRGYTDMMIHGIGGKITGEQRQFLEAIQQNSLRMEAMVSDLLVIGQLEAGRVEIDQEVLSVDQAIHNALSMFDQTIAKGQLTVTLELSEGLPQIYADQHRVDQILVNLFSNAVKYTPPGGRIRIEARPLDELFVEIAVSDSGIGMSQQEQERLFTPFYRAESAIRQQIQGTGLGLNIVRSLVELHGGSIAVSSVQNEGSTFRITLPIYQGSGERGLETGGRRPEAEAMYGA